MKTEWHSKNYTIFTYEPHQPSDGFLITIHNKYPSPPMHFTGDDLNALISTVFSLQFLGMDLSKWKERP